MKSERSDRRGRRVLVLLLVLTAITLMNLDLRRGPSSPLGGARAAVASALGPAQRGLQVLAQPLRDLADDRTAARDDEVRALQAEVARLQAQARTAELDRSRAAELDALLGLTSAGGYTTVPAQVVALSPWQQAERTITVDAGSRDGIGPDMTVVNGDGLVGRVIAVTTSTATVQLLIDPAARVGVRLAGSAQLGLARVGPGGVTYEPLDPLEALADGDPVVTFGSPGGRPFVAGVPVGELADVSGAAGTPARLVPYVDFSTLDLVGIVIEAPRTDPRGPLVATSPPDGAG